MARSKIPPEVNAGSMADIAFLLLIFFLVTTTLEKDLGLDRKIPITTTQASTYKAKRNLFEVIINKNNNLFVQGEIMQMNNLRASMIDFLDNGGISEECGYCKGKRSPESSDSPKKAFIMFKSDRESNYMKYIAVQNEINGAYQQLRNRQAKLMYNTSFAEMEKLFYEGQISTADKMKLKQDILRIRNMYPLNIVETDINH